MIIPLYFLVSTKYFIYNDERNCAIDYLILSNDLLMKKKFFLDNPNYRIGAGLSSYSSFPTASYYYNLTFMEDYLREGFQLNGWANQNHTIASNISMMLWYIKDNSVSVNYSDVFSIIPDLFARSVDYNPTYNSSGKGLDTTWNYEEIQAAKEIYFSIKKIPTKYNLKRSPKSIEDSVGNMTDSLNNNYDYNDSHRIERSQQFLVQARTTPVLTIKISNYIMMLEALFSDNESGVSKNVPIRASCYLFEKLVDRQLCYDFLAVSYDLRSRYVHGNLLTDGSEDFDVLMDVSNKLDSILRSILTKIVTKDFMQFINADQIYFDGLVDKNITAINQKDIGKDNVLKVKSFVI